MENLDERFEKYLGEFQPRRPRPLPEPAIHRQAWPRRLAAAAVAAIALGASLWFVGKKNKWSGGELGEKKTAAIQETKSAPQPLSLLPLTQLALENPEKLEAELTRASQRVLPDFRGSESTLRVLAKE
ncbi:MAG: hypothetical protein WBB89_12385 [Candidatus Acidiferrum sp.]